MAWLKDLAPKAVQGDRLNLADGTTAELDLFETIFAEVPTLVGGGMSAYDALVQVDGGTRGWKDTFDDWKAKGWVA